MSDATILNTEALQKIIDTISRYLNETADAIQKAKKTIGSCDRRSGEITPAHDLWDDQDYIDVNSAIDALATEFEFLRTEGEAIAALAQSKIDDIRHLRSIGI